MSTALRAVATAANWFFPGLGYVIAGPTPTKRGIGAAWLVGMIGLTYVEFGIQTAAPAFYWPMFGSVMLFNTAFAIDTWLELSKLAAPAAATA